MCFKILLCLELFRNLPPSLSSSSSLCFPFPLSVSISLFLSVSVSDIWFPLSPLVPSPSREGGNWQNFLRTKGTAKGGDQSKRIAPQILNNWPMARPSSVCLYLLRRRQITTALYRGSFLPTWLHGALVAVSAVKQHFSHRTTGKTPGADNLPLKVAWQELPQGLRF